MKKSILFLILLIILTSNIHFNKVYAYENIYLNETINSNSKFDYKEAIRKIKKASEAYKKLISQNKKVENEIIKTCEEAYLGFSPDIKTYDGISIYNEGAAFAVGVNYYYDFINKDKPYFDFSTYIKNNSYNKIFNQHLPDDFLGRDTIELIMMEAIGLMPYINNCKLIKYGKLVEFSPIEIKCAKAKYSMAFSCNGKKDELTAIFDENGNLLNIIPSNRKWNKYMYTF